MEIAIVGAGVLGSIFGGLFLEKGFNVTLIEVLEERVRLIDKEGLWLQWPDGERTHLKIAITFPEARSQQAYLVLMGGR